MLELQTLSLYFTLFLALFFEIFLLITYLEVRGEVKFENEYVGKDVKRFPSVSIIVPCFNEEKTAEATVRSILDIDYPSDKLSLILIDDGSTDHTLEILNKFEGHPQVRVFSKPNEGSKFSALNFGLNHVNTDLVGCLDADSFVDADALRKIVPFFDDESTMAVIPSIKVHEPKNVLQLIQKVEYAWGIFLRRMLSSIGALYVTPGPFSIFRTQVFRDLGGYKHAHHTEDMEMALRMQKNRYKIVNSHMAHVYTVAPDKFKKLYKQRVRWTYGYLNNVIDYKEMFFNRKYGHIGLFILPMATISIFSTLYAAGNMAWVGSTKIGEIIRRYQAVGFQWKFPTLSFDWFFLNTGVVSLLSAFAIVLTLYMLFLAIRLSDGKFRISREVFYYMALYIFMPPIWLTKAVFNTLFKKKISWR
jgi:cellulose synthase/poly-beta-1,6-N-acetylglucosamine synthase-like glycosyltransferase